MNNSWDDYKIFLAVVENKNFSNAAKKLHVNHTTVFRRINALEDNLKTKLFEKTPQGNVLTIAGAQLYDDIKGLNEKIEIAGRKILGQDIKLKGSIKLATSDTLGFTVLPELIKEFNKIHPEIFIDLIISPQAYDLSRREADIALRVTENPPQYLVGRNLGKIKAVVAYSKKNAPKKKKSLEQILSHDNWIIGSEQLNSHKNNRWLLQNCTSQKFVAAANHMIGIAKLVQSGVGYGIIPNYLTKILPNLVGLHRIEELDISLWILTHEDLRNNARIKVLMDFLAKKIKKII